MESRQRLLLSLFIFLCFYTNFSFASCNKDEYLKNQLLPEIKQAKKEIGGVATQIPTSLVVAQATLESSLCSSKLSKSHKNLFGLKGGKGKKGKAKYAKFSTVKDGVKYYLATLSNHKAYEKFRAHLGVSNAVVLSQYLRKYAEDPNYTTKIANVIKEHNLMRFDAWFTHVKGGIFISPLFTFLYFFLTFVMIIFIIKILSLILYLVDKVNIINSFQVVWNTDCLDLNDYVHSRVNKTLDNFFDVVEYDIKNELNISHLDFYQLSNWIFVQKNVTNKFVSEYREKIYTYFENKYWALWIETFFYVLNSSLWLYFIEKLKLNLEDDFDIENMYILSIIELELIWKSDLSKNVLFNFLDTCLNPEICKVLSLFFYEKKSYDYAFKFLIKLSDTDIFLDKELFDIYYFLHYSWLIDKDDKKLSDNRFFTILSERENDVYIKHKHSLKDNLSFVIDKVNIYQYYLDYYIKHDKEGSLISKYSNLSLELWNKKSCYYIVYSELLANNYVYANEIYLKYKNEWIFNYDLKFWKYRTEDYEKFLLSWVEKWIFWFTDLYVNYYRDFFSNNPFNKDIFYNFIIFCKNNNYVFADDDKIFFTKFNDYHIENDNDFNITTLLDEIFHQYEITFFELYLEKILIFISKVLRWVYKNTIYIKYEILKKFEKFSLKQYYPENSQIFKKYYIERISLLDNLDYLEFRFDEMVKLFVLNEKKHIKDVSNDFMISSILASIFEFYWMKNELNEVLVYDKFFEITNKKAQSLQ